MIPDEYYVDLVSETQTGGADDGAQMRPFSGVAFMLSSLGYAISRRFKQTLEPFDLEPREFALLRSVSFAEGRSQHALGDRLQIPPSRMVAIVDELEQRGLVERRANPDDRRVRLLHLTDNGRGLLQQAFAEAVDYEQQISAPLTAEEQRQLLDFLERIAGAIGIDPGAAHSALREPSDGGDRPDC